MDWLNNYLRTLGPRATKCYQQTTCIIAEGQWCNSFPGQELDLIGKSIEIASQYTAMVIACRRASMGRRMDISPMRCVPIDHRRQIDGVSFVS